MRENRGLGEQVSVRKIYSFELILVGVSFSTECVFKSRVICSDSYTYLLPEVSQWVIGLGWDQLGFPVR